MKKILLIDDDLLFGESLSLELRDAGYIVSYLAEPSKSFTEEFNEIFDIALIDLRLKNQSGLNLIEDLKEHSPNCHIIMMTGFGTIASAVNAIKLGASDYLTKPVTVTKIEDILNADKLNLEGEEGGSQTPLSLDRVEREYIEHILVQEKGNISKAAEKLGLHRQSLQRKLKKWVPFK